MFDPTKDDYPQNADGKPEFQTISIHVDAISQQARDDLVVHKAVYSTEDPIGTLVSNAAYFNEPHLFANPSNARMLALAGTMADPVFVYTPPRPGTTLILMSTPTFDGLRQNPNWGEGSVLMTFEKLVDAVASQQAQLQQMAGGFSPVLVMNFSNTDEDALSSSGSSDGGPGSDAESLVERSAFENVGDHEQDA